MEAAGNEPAQHFLRLSPYQSRYEADFRGLHGRRREPADWSAKVSVSMLKARPTASARLLTASLSYTLSRCLRIVPGEIENGGDLAVRLPSRHPEKNFALPGSERCERPRLPLTRGRVAPELDKVRLEGVENKLVSFAEVALETVEPETTCYPVRRRKPELELILAVERATNLPVQVEGMPLAP